MTSSVGSISFPKQQPDLTVTRASKIVRRQITEDSKSKDVIEFWVDFGGAVAQVNTLTITAGTTGDDYIVDISNGTVSAIATYTMQTGDTATIIASRIAEEINGLASTSALVSATVAGAVITITADNPGVAITYDVSESTTPANLVVAQTTASSGVAKMGKVSEVKIYFEIPSGGRNQQIVTQTIFYTGANPAVEVRRNTEQRANHPQSMETLETALA